MSPPHKSALTIIAIILYGLVAGLAATIIIVLGSIFLRLLAARIFSQLGWESAMGVGLRSVYYTFIPGLIVGMIVCFKVWISRLRNAPTT